MRDSLTYPSPLTALNPRSCLVLASRFWPCRRRGRIDDDIRRSTKRAAALVQIQRILSTPQGPFVARREDQLLGLDGAAASHVRVTTRAHPHTAQHWTSGWPIPCSRHGAKAALGDWIFPSHEPTVWNPWTRCPLWTCSWTWTTGRPARIGDCCRNSESPPSPLPAWTCAGAQAVLVARTGSVHAQGRERYTQGWRKLGCDSRWASPGLSVAH